MKDRRGALAMAALHEQIPCTHAVRGAIRLGLCLVLFAGVAAACGSSQATGQSAGPNLSSAASSQGPAACAQGPAASSQGPAASAQAPSVSFDTTAFSCDGGGYGTSGTALEDAGYTDRYQDLKGIDHMAEAYAIIVHGLPSAVDLNQVQSAAPGAITCEVVINWQPMGRRDTVLPPGNHGERIYELDLDIGPYVKGGDAVAYVWFLSRAQGNALDPNDLTATPSPYPNQAFSFKIDKATAAALLDLFWVKGAAPTAS
jgi:hypothetical protein